MVQLSFPVNFNLDILAKLKKFVSRGSAPPMKMGGMGTRQQRSQDFLQRITHTKNRKLSGFGPLFS